MFLQPFFPGSLDDISVIGYFLLLFYIRSHWTEPKTNLQLMYKKGFCANTKKTHVMMKWKKSLPGMDDKVVHWKLHYFALQDVPQGGDDEVIIERIWGRQRVKKNDDKQYQA